MTTEKFQALCNVKWIPSPPDTGGVARPSADGRAGVVKCDEAFKWYSLAGGFIMSSALGAMGVAGGILLLVLILIVAITVAAVRRGESAMEDLDKK